jgi:putative oxidoreductase
VRNTELGGSVITAFDIAILVLRITLGVTMAAHGYNKFHGRDGIAGTAGWFDSVGMKPGDIHARVAASAELAAGIGLAAGFLTPIPAAGFVALMLVAAWTVHRHNGFFIVKEGWEYNLILAVAALAVACTGAGRVSLDYVLFNNTEAYQVLSGGYGGGLIALTLGMVGGIGQLVIFFRPPG